LSFIAKNAVVEKGFFVRLFRKCEHSRRLRCLNIWQVEGSERESAIGEIFLHLTDLRMRS